MKVKRDKSLAPLEPIPSSTAEEYADAKALEREKFLRDRKMKAVYTVVNLMRELGFYEFLRLSVDAMHAFDHTTHHHRHPESADLDTAVHHELYRIARALAGNVPHPAGKPINISIRLTPDEARAIAKWHDDTSDKKASYAEITEFVRVVLEQNLAEIIAQFRPVLPAKIKRRRRSR